MKRDLSKSATKKWYFFSVRFNWCSGCFCVETGIWFRILGGVCGEKHPPIPQNVNMGHSKTYKMGIAIGAKNCYYGHGGYSPAKNTARMGADIK